MNRQTDKHKTTSSGENVEILKPLCIVNGSVTRCNCLKNGMNIPPKIKNRITILSSNPMSRYICKWIESMVLKRYLHTYSSNIPNNQEEEAMQMSIDSWMNKQNMLYTYYRILFNLKNSKEIRLHATHGWPFKYYVLSNKLVTKRHTLYDSTYLKYLKYNGGYQELEGGGAMGVVI